MRKFAVILGLVLLGFGLLVALPQLGTSQFAIFQTTEVTDPHELKMEIAVLKVVNELELSREQIESLLVHIDQIRTGRDAVFQAELEMRDFLVGFNGTREEYREAIKPFEESVDQAEQLYYEQLEASVDELRDILSMRQGDILRGQDRYYEQGRIRALPGNRIVIPSWRDRGNFRMEYDDQRAEEALKQFEIKMEGLGERLGEMGERLGDRLGRIFGEWESDDWDFDFDFDWDGDHNLHMFEHFEMPNVHIEINPDQFMMHGMLSDFLFENLDVLERVLRAKLDAIVPQSTPFESEQGDESSV